jgi:HSP20 family molecular chaperone IbpA
MYLSDKLDFSDFMDLLASNQKYDGEYPHSSRLERPPMAHILKRNIPGLTKKYIKIQVEEGDQVLEIRGELPKKEFRKNETYSQTCCRPCQDIDPWFLRAILMKINLEQPGGSD